MDKKNFISALILRVIYIILVVGLIWHNKAAYVLLLVSACVFLIVIQIAEGGIMMKLWAALIILYSVMVLIGVNGSALMDKMSGNELIPLILILMSAAEILAVRSGVIILLFLLVGLIFLEPLVKEMKINILNKIYGPLPNVSDIVKKDKKIYFHKDYHDRKLQLIYCHGHKKTVLDTYEYHLQIMSATHYSLEWNGDRNVIVRQYDDIKRKIIMEKTIILPGN